jgi:hypothetical protein
MVIPWIEIGAIAAVVTTLIAVLAYCRPPGVEVVSPPEAARTGNDANPVPPSSASGNETASRVNYLANLQPIRGHARLAQLPTELADDPSYVRSIVIACPSNQTGDQISEVTFETRNRFTTFQATLRSYRDPPDDVLIELHVFSDPPDRDPGVPLGGTPQSFQLRVGESQPISTAIEKAYHLRLRARCEKPGGFVILTSALVR